VEAMLEVVQTLEHKLSIYAAIVLKKIAYAGSGNFLKVQEMIRCLSVLPNISDTYVLMYNNNNNTSVSEILG
jgi:hypothetical protein